MKNIWKIFVMDIKGLAKNILALIIAIGICFLPSLYAWFNIYSNWDPYANTANIKIAVSTEDEGYTKEDGSLVNMGDEVIDQLKENKKIGWTAVKDTQDAIDGVYSGEYYAAVVIGSDFSYSMYNSLSTDFDENPTIVYYENEKKNAVGTKITDTAVATLKQSINETFIKVVTSTIFEQTNSLADELESGDGMDAFEEKLKNLNSNLTSYSTLITTFIDSNDALVDSINNVNGQIPGLSNSIGKGATSLNNANTDLQKTGTSLENYSANVTASLNNIKASMDTISSDITNANLAEDAKQVADCTGQAVSDTQALTQQLNDLYQIISDTQGGTGGGNDETGTGTDETTEEAKKALQDVLDTIDSLKGSAADIEDKLNGVISSNNPLTPEQTEQAKEEADKLKQEAQDAASAAAAESVNKAAENMKSTLSSCSQSVEDMRNLYTNSLVPQMNNVIDSMSNVLSNASTILNDLSSTMGNMSTVFTGLETTVSGTNDSLEQIQEVIDAVNTKISTIIEKLDSVNDDERVQALLDVMHGDPETYGEYFSEPVTILTEEVYPIKNYGSAMTPFYTVLALWVGAIILVAIVKVKAEPKNLTNVKSYQLFFGRFLLFYVLGQLQAAIVVLGDIYLLHCQIEYPVLFWFVASMASFTFTLLIYSLTLSFGDIGKAFAVVIMVIQIAGSSGTFPIELLPAVYRNIYIFFPFPYAINAMRETIGGMYGSTYMTSLAELAIFAVVGLLIGLVIRIPFVGINHFVEKRMEDTKMM